MSLEDGPIDIFAEMAFIEVRVVRAFVDCSISAKMHKALRCASGGGQGLLQMQWSQHFHQTSTSQWQFLPSHPQGGSVEDNTDMTLNCGPLESMHMLLNARITQLLNAHTQPVSAHITRKCLEFCSAMLLKQKLTS